MRKPIRKTMMHMAVASACSWLAVTAHAQEAGAPQASAEPGAAAAQPAGEMAKIVVSGSRIVSPGFTQPTPTTTLSAADLEKSAKPNVFNSLIELPALQGSTGRTTGAFSTSSGTQGLSSLSLRGLSPIRTLTLLDGQRVVGANVSGVTDVSQFPQLLIKRVDVVTGGASASYGSDAVGGVVNFITDKKFQGFKANLEGGVTTYGDDEHGTIQTAFGKAFMNDRLHLVGSAEYGREKGVPNPGFGPHAANGRDWYQNTVYTNRGLGVSGVPQLRVINNAQQTQYSKWGLITAGPLAGTAFNEAGQPYQFEYGANPVGSFREGGDLSGSVGAGTSLGMDLTRKVLYGRAGFDLDANNEIYATASWSEVGATFSPNPGAAKQGNLTMQCSNPYLPQSVRERCAAAGITDFRYGTVNAIFPKFIEVNPTRTLKRATVGAEGRFNLLGKEWGYNGYLEHGENEIEIIVHNMTLNNRYDQAIQATTLNGQIVCANPVARASGCKPINVFGGAPIDPAAWAYIAPANGPRQYSKQKQQVASFNITGEPFETWAGPVAIATGAEWRKEQYYVKGDPYGNGVFADSPNTPEYPADPILNRPEGNHWYAGNYHNGRGSYTVKEAYVEAGVPLLKSDALGDFDINVAARRTNYSTAGYINAWKLGGTWETPYQGLRVRAVKSRDVRAPNLSELFAAPVVVNAAVTVGSQSVQVQQRTIGNTALRPEVADNLTVGLVLTQPTWAPGFSASVDYFDVKVKDVISTLGNQDLVNLCLAGNQEICGTMQLNAPAGGTNYVTAQAFNLASLRSRGYDFEVAYRTQPNAFGIPGRLTFRALATHMLSFLSTSGVRGSIASEQAGVNMGNTPDWKVLASQSWDWDKWNVILTERWVSDGVRSNEFIECQTGCPVSTSVHRTIYDNHMDGAFYVDIGATYKVNDRVSVYAKVDNVGDRDPVAAPQENPSYAINPALYDVLGRVYRVGLRYSF